MVNRPRFHVTALYLVWRLDDAVHTHAVDRTHIYDLWHAGCRDIIRETFDGSMRMGRSAYEAMGVNAHHAKQMKDAFMDLDREAMFSVPVAPSEVEEKGG